MAKLDLVFEGGGAKGMVLVGALDVLLNQRGHTSGRLLGTSAGAITATLLAAGYTVPEMLAALEEKENGKPVFESFLGKPAAFDSTAVRNSSIRRFLRDVNLKFIPDFVEDKLDDQIAQQLADHPQYGNLYSFVERGGWFSAEAFVPWIRRKLNEGSVNGTPRRFGEMTLAQFHEATGVELSLVVSNTSAQRMLILNHNTAPKCPVVWAVRMSMNIPLLWDEVVWKEEWGPYLGKSVTGHIIVDGGMLSNFPISLFLSPDANVKKFMGEATADYVLGMLIDEATMVPVPDERTLIEYSGNVQELETYKRAMRLVNTMITAHDRASIELFKEHVVRLPAGGYGTTEFDMSDVRRAALLEAGRVAMRSYLDKHPNIFAQARGLEMAAPVDKEAIANEVARSILEQP